MFFKDLEGQLARWSERFQQYNFEICHRKAQAHGNAHELSRHPCFEAKCKYCSKVEVQDAQNVLREEEIVSRLILEGISSEEWQKEQLENQIVSIFLQRKERHC